MRNTFYLIIAMVLIGFSLSGCTSPQNLTVNDPWGRPAIQGNNSAVYFHIENPGSDNDVLVGAECDIADLAELHRSLMDANGVMTMQQQSEVEVPAGGEIDFSPGGLHVMLIGLRQNLVPEDTFSVTLTFENAGIIPIEVRVREP